MQSAISPIVRRSHGTGTWWTDQRASLFVVGSGTRPRFRPTRAHEIHRQVRSEWCHPQIAEPLSRFGLRGFVKIKPTCDSVQALIDMVHALMRNGVVAVESGDLRLQR